MVYQNITIDDIEALDNFTKYIEELVKYGESKQKELNDKIGYNGSIDIKELFEEFIAKYIKMKIEKGIEND